MMRRLSFWRGWWWVVGAALVVWWAFSTLQFAGWERMLKGPFGGLEVSVVGLPRRDSSLHLPGDHLLYVSNAYTNRGGDDWPLLVLEGPGKEVRWGRVLQPEVRVATSPTVQTPFVRDVALEGIRSGNGTLKVVFSCFWGAGGQERGIVYLNRETLGFEGFSVSW